MDYNQDKCEELEDQSHYSANYDKLGNRLDPKLNQCKVCTGIFETSDPNQDLCGPICKRYFDSKEAE